MGGWWRFWAENQRVPWKDATGGGEGLASFGFWAENEGGFLFGQYKQKSTALLG
jgi:hypothetical protein